MANNLFRRTITGPGAEVLANRGKKFLKYVEALPNFFGNAMLDESFKNAMASRNIFYPDGSILKTRRGEIGRVEAYVPEPITVTELAVAYGYIALDAYDDTGVTRTGVILIPLGLAGKPKYYDASLGAAVDSYFNEDHPVKYKDVYSSATHDIPGAGMFRELVGAFTEATDGVGTGTSTVDNYAPDAGGYIHTITSGSRITRAGGTVLIPYEYAVYEFELIYGALETVNPNLLSTEEHYYPPAAPVSGYYSFAGESGYRWYKVNEPKPSPLVMPNVDIREYSGQYNNTGTVLQRAKNFGYISADRHAFAYYRQTDLYSATIDQPVEAFTTTNWSTLVNHARVLNAGITQVLDAYFDPNYPIGCGAGVSDSLLCSGYVRTNTVSVILKVDGTEFTLESYNALVELLSIVWLNYFKFPDPLTSDALAAYTYTLSDYTTGEGFTFWVGKVTNGVEKKRGFNYDAINPSLVDFGNGLKKFVWGGARILFRLPEDNV